MGFTAVDDKLLDRGMTESNGCPAEYQRHKSPRKEMGCDKKGAGCHEKKEEDS